jgi:SAM-dependent methyltransferase
MPDFDYQWAKLPSANIEYQPARIKEFLKHVKLDRSFFAGKRCLDCGCGNGRWTWAMQQLGANVTSLDVSPDAVAACRTVNPSAYVANILELEPTAGWDFVLCWGVLHHTADPREGFRRVAAQVKPGGTLHVMLYHRDTQQPYEAGRKIWSTLSEAERLDLCRKKVAEYGGDIHGWWDAFNPTYNFSYHERDIERWFREEGFKDIVLTAKYNINMRGVRA